MLDPLDITGRGFAGLRLDAPITDGPVELSARRSTTWVEGPTPAAGDQPATRLLLDGDVRVRLGTYEFSAARACVWLAPLPAGDPEAGPNVRQVFAYFDRVGTPAEDAAISVAADRLPVRAVMRMEDSVVLRADRRHEGRPDDPFVREAERQLAATLRRQVGGPAGQPEPVPLRPRDGATGPISRPFEPDALGPGAGLAEVEASLPPAEANEPIFAPGGLIALHTPGDIRSVSTPEENTIIAERGGTVQYWDARSGHTMQLTAGRVVLFLDPGPLPEVARFGVESVRGIYLEGDVLAEYDRYTLRAPRIYYDVRGDRAILVDAVFWTYEEKRALPLYVRARTIRQESRERFTVEGGRLATSSFLDPGMSLGATSVTIRTLPAEGGAGGSRTVVDARDTTIRLGGVPVFYWPRYVGDPTRLPITGLRIDNADGSGTAIKTAWNAYGLLGLEPPAGVSLDLLADYYFERGPALGTDWSWGTGDTRGRLFAYGVLNDQGSDLLTTGKEIGHDGEFRGMVLGEHRAALTREWTLFAEGAYISDETFVDGFFESLAHSRREITSDLSLRRLDANTYLSVQARHNFNDFIATDYLLQSQGYSVSKVPEAEYLRVADDLLPEAAPGLLTWSSEYRAGAMALNFSEPTAAELGFTTPALADSLFGIDPDESIGDALRASGLSEDAVGRFDTRQELTMALKAGPVAITPFAVARFTAYDSDFSAYSPEADDSHREWGGAGLRVATSVQRVDDSIESPLLDLHRVRHIVEPSLTAWTAGATIDQADLPVYDDDVESIAEGSTVRFAIDQTWQTQRGAPGRWRSVDVLTLDLEVVSSDGEGDPESPIGRWIDYRPELSNLGDFVGLQTAWQATEVLTLAGLTTYDLEASQPARTVVGGLLRHTPELSTFAEIRFVNSQDQTYANLGAQYTLTDKYYFSGSTAYDTDRGQIQSYSVEFRRRFSGMTLGLGISFNEITDEVSFGIVFQPAGLTGAGARIRGIGAENERQKGSTFGG